jgi:hypothetical protein
MIAEKLAVEDTFFLFEVQGSNERRLLDTETPAEIHSGWKSSNKTDCKFVAKQQSVVGQHKVVINKNMERIKPATQPTTPSSKKSAKKRKQDPADVAPALPMVRCCSYLRLYWRFCCTIIVADDL